MTTLAGATKAAERLRGTGLRDFGPPLDEDDGNGVTYKLSLPREETPVPNLIRYALTLIGLSAYGPGEKVEWWVSCTFRGHPCTVAHEKFGVRIYLRSDAPEESAQKTLSQIAKKLKSSMRTVEKVVLAAAPDLLNQGNATVVNQHFRLRMAYEYFRDRALNPTVIEDERVEYGPGDGIEWAVVKSGRIQMELNAFHDLVAAITSYISLLEHDLVLALAFGDFDPAEDDLTGLIGSRWRDKFARVVGMADPGAVRFRERLTAVVERWRNPYSHGGFEKGHEATIYLHAPGVGAVPVGMTSVRHSPLFSLIPASDTEIAEVFALFDEMDEWLESTLPYAMKWIKAGLVVRFDGDFRQESQLASRSSATFQQYLDGALYRQEMIDNMDY